VGVHVGRRVAVCDLDGTLLDSDEALLAPFVALGIDPDAVGRGRPVAEECAVHGVTVAQYVAAYDTTVVAPFPGVAELVAGLDRWAVCSNKHQGSGRAELARLGWEPEVSLFTDAFDGPKRLGPVLDRLGVGPREIVFLGDTAHDRACAHEVGATFALAGWNPRARPEAGDEVLRHPSELFELLEGDRRGSDAR
jgi:phosphoglycolate phosphatase-like HAD superfamily hydrolase